MKMDWFIWNKRLIRIWGWLCVKQNRKYSKQEIYYVSFMFPTYNFRNCTDRSVNFRFCLLFTWDILWTGGLETLALRWGPIADSVWCACYCLVIDGVSPRWLADSAVMKWLPRLCWLGSLTCTWICRGTYLDVQGRRGLSEKWYITELFCRGCNIFYGRM